MFKECQSLEEFPNCGNFNCNNMKFFSMFGINIFKIEDYV